MADRRQKNRDWNVANEIGQLHDNIKDAVMVAVLMDIRDELQQLNAVIGCSNFTGIPATLREIARNTKKPKEKT